MTASHEEYIAHLMSDAADHGRTDCCKVPPEMAGLLFCASASLQCNQVHGELLVVPICERNVTKLDKYSCKCWFVGRLDHKLLGSRAKRYGARLKMVAVIETNADGRLHYHAMIDRPYHCTFGSFRTVVVDQWLRTDFGYRQVDIQDAATIGWGGLHDQESAEGVVDPGLHRQE